MALTLLVENNPQIIEIYQLNLTIYVGLEIMVAKDLKEAKEKIANNPFELIITRNRIESQDMSEALKTLTASLNRHVPLLIMGQPNTQSANGLDLKSVVKGAAQALGITAQHMAQKPVEDFYPLSIHYFSWIVHPVCDVYSATLEGGYQLKFKAQAPLNPKELTEQHCLFVSKLDRLRIVNQITAELMGRLEDKDLTQDEALLTGASNLQLLSQKFAQFGITDETVSLAQKSMASIKRNVKTYPKIGQLLQRMLANQTGHLYRHTQIVSYVGLQIVKNIDWGTPEQEEKMVFIAFFHDILIENDSQALIHSKEELRTCGLNAREKTLVERHAQLAAELVHKYPHAPMGADQIIRQHHGMLNGMSFSDHYGANLSPMAIVFIVAEEFTRIILKRESGPYPVKDMLRELRESFPTSRFQKIIDALEDIKI